ncbi:MAG: calcium/sodium antiporter [Anaerolineae bacterium]|nr:calcium/sodium antiporter [Anaerolineae bacterium]
MSAIISLLIMVVAIYLLSIITDEFFIESLDEMSRLWKLPSNVVGASLMAMGSSAPELAIALFALFLSGGEHSDVGIGTIVGSAVFNILVITGVSAIARPARVTWHVVVRDCVIYVASIGLLLVALADGTIIWLEAVAFLGLYGVYIYILFQWNAFMPGEEVDVVEVVESEIHHAPASHLVLHQKVSWVVQKGIGLLMGNPRRAFLRAFFVSIGLIAAISWVLVDHAVKFAEAIGMPPIIVALTVLAVGTSVPDMISSVIVARQGRGEMAIANAVGSNIFNILVGLGLPWLIAILLRGTTVPVGAENLWLSAVILLVTVIVLFVFLSTGRLLSRREGWVLVGVYTIFLLWTWLEEMLTNMG